MRASTVGVLSASAAAFFSASTSMAQLVFGSTTTATTNPGAFYLDVTTNTVTTMWNSATNKKVNGMAADTTSGKIYANDAARLNVWSYGSVGTTPTLIAGLYRTNGTTTSATGVDGLAWANGNLYGSTSFASTTFSRGIYQINTVPDALNHCIMTPLWTTTNGTTVLGGLEFNPADNLFYVTSTVDTLSSGGLFGLGLYSIDAFGTGAVNKIANFPTGRTGVDGLAFGGGKFWMTEQIPASNRIDIYPYDPVAGTYGTTIHVPLTDATGRATGAAWAPGALSVFPSPGTAALLGIGGLTMGLRRRR